MTAPRPEAVELARAIVRAVTFDEYDEDVWNATDLIDAALTAARADERERACRLLSELENEVREADDELRRETEEWMAEKMGTVRTGRCPNCREQVILDILKTCVGDRRDGIRNDAMCRKCGAVIGSRLAIDVVVWVPELPPIISKIKSAVAAIRAMEGR